MRWAGRRATPCATDPVGVSSMRLRRDSESSPERMATVSAGITENVFVYRTGVQSESNLIPVTRNLPYVSWTTSTAHQMRTQ